MAAQREMNTPSSAAPPTFPYGARCGVYSIVLLLSITGVILAALMLSFDTFMTLTENCTRQATTFNYTLNRMLYVATLPYYDQQYFTMMDRRAPSVEAALDPAASYMFVYPPAGVRAAGGAAIVAAVFSGVLVILTSVVLGVLGCQRRRERRCAAAAVAEERQWEAQMAALQAAGNGADVRVVNVHEPYLPRERATVVAARAAHDARVRQGLGITCLLFEFICLVMSIVSVAGSFAGESNIKTAVAKALTTYNGTVHSVTYDKAIDQTSVWPCIANLVIFFVATVLLAVPFLSGIADRPAASASAQSAREDAAAAHYDDVEMQQTSTPASFTK